jgi:hypothetical protein
MRGDLGTVTGMSEAASGVESGTRFSVKWDSGGRDTWVARFANTYDLFVVL